MSGSLGFRLAAFGALCAYAVGHWGGLVAYPPAWRLAAVAATATAAGGLLAASAGIRGPAGPPVRVALSLCALAAGFAAAGLEPRLLLPGNWDQLGGRLEDGLAGLPAVEWPYTGNDEVVRLVILLGAPALALPAALLAFWPARRAASLLQALALLLLLVVYGVAVTEREFAGELLRGAGVALLVAAWLWVPRARRGEARLAAAAVGAATLLAVPAAAALDRDSPWVDYQSWNPFGAIDGSTFDWNHSYGPIDWPREGTTLMRVKADRSLYWKVEVLDRFDGLRWLRSGAGVGTSPAVELPAERNPAWEASAAFTVGDLRSERAVVTGIPLAVRGLGRTDTALDGTTTPRDGRLGPGDSYTVSAYVPDPGRPRLRAAPPESYENYRHYRRYLRIELPRQGVTNLDRRAAAPGAGVPITVALPFRGEPEPRTMAATERLLRSSPYARVYELAGRLTAGAPTTYDAVKAVEAHLLDGYRYDEGPPDREYPLDAFLFEDRAGYCQQFSGAMALLLRMAGIPARVVGGFAPGSFNRDSGEYRVRDLDAHSWVEVHFSGIGWVQFDPTPSAAPAESRAQPRESATSATGSTQPPRGLETPFEIGSQPAPPVPPAADADSGFPRLAVAAWIAALAALAIAGVALLRRRRTAAGAEPALRELTRALGRLGHPLPPGTTLLALERRLTRAAGPRSAAYVRALREVRFGGEAAALPGAAERRALRRELGRRAGPAGRLRSWAAIPPFTRS